MKIDDFDYDLPPELIAQYPAERRDRSRLLVMDKNNGKINHHTFYDIVSFLKKGDLLILNDSRVFPARLHGTKERSGGRVEILLNHQISDYSWEVVGKGLIVDTRIRFGNSPLEAVVLQKKEQVYTVQFNFSDEKLFVELEKIGEVPLPPYIKRTEEQDKKRYQTVYAKKRGSVAAPTAGLHFTDQLLKKIKEKGIDIEYLTLHVGLGTFAPVKCENVEEHKMHREHYTISYDVLSKIAQTKTRGGRIIAVGTTSCRVLETVYSQNKLSIINDQFSINPPSSAKVIDSIQTLSYIRRAPEGKQITNSNFQKTTTRISGWTNIFIYPPYKFKCVDGLITNFHLPKSSLLMLVSAFAGKQNIKHAYDRAIAEKYHFFSYGDAMLII